MRFKILRFRMKIIVTLHKIFARCCHLLSDKYESLYSECLDFLGGNDNETH